MATLLPIKIGVGRDKGSVIFAHGLGGDAFTTWGGGNVEHADFWPTWLANEPSLANLAFYTLSYEAHPSARRIGRRMRLIDYGRQVIAALGNEPRLLDAPIAFVCHSLGGLVVKQLLLHANKTRDHLSQKLLDQVAQIFFIATPHRGAKLPVIADRWLFPTSVIMKTLRYDSIVLDDLNSEYTTFHQGNARAIQHLVFEEKEAFKGVFIVPTGAVDPGVPHRRVPITEDHIGIAKPKSTEDLLYKTVHNALSSLASDFSYDVFISWASGDRDAAVQLQNLLEAHDLYVSMGREQGTKRTRSEARRRDLCASRKVVVLWSQNSCTNQLVLAEADLAAVQGKLVSYRTEPCEPPAEYTDVPLIDDFNADVDRILRDVEKRQIVQGNRDSQLDFGDQINKIPETSGSFIGRVEERQRLHEAWSSGRTRIVSIEAFGGEGKTALLRQFLTEFHKKHPSCPIFCWSAYTQGSHENSRQAANDLFYGSEESPGMFRWLGSDTDKARFRREAEVGKRLAELIRERRMLLVLDGLEPIQDLPSVNRGRLRDRSLAALVEGLKEGNPGMVVLTSRQPIVEVEDDAEPRLLRIKLAPLDTESGVQLLKSRGVVGEVKEMARAVQMVGGHALTLNLLGTWLNTDEDAAGEIAHWQAAFRSAVEKDPAAALQVRSAQAVLTAYVNRLSRLGEDGSVGEGRPELNWLSIIGLFDGAADWDAVASLLKEPPIEGLTDALLGSTRQMRQVAITRLRKLGLILPRDETLPPKDKRRRNLDAHPIVRAYFRARLKEKEPAFKEANKRLYEHYKAERLHPPRTRQEMQPLLQAVAHGCAAGLFRRVYDEVWRPLLDKHGEFYIGQELGAYSTALSGLSYFFDSDPRWEAPAGRLPLLKHTDLLHQAGFALKALGQIKESAVPLQRSVDLSIGQQQWARAVGPTCSLVELFLLLGKVKEAVAFAKQGVVTADKTAFPFYQIVARATLGHALHLKGGAMRHANRQFLEAEERQVALDPDRPILTSTSGYHFCELLLDRKMHGEVAERARRLLKWLDEGDGADDAQQWLDEGDEDDDAQQLSGYFAPNDRMPLERALAQLYLGRAEHAAYRASVAAKAGVQNPGAVEDRDRPSVEPNPNGQPTQHWGTEPLAHIDSAVDTLRDLGREDMLPLALLARAALQRDMGDFQAASEDLDEVGRAIERCGTALYHVDLLLERAYLALAQKTSGNGRGDLEVEIVSLCDAAHKSMVETGYRRRRDELGAILVALRGSGVSERPGRRETRSRDLTDSATSVPAVLTRTQHRFEVHFPCREGVVKEYYDLLRQLFEEEIIPTFEFLQALAKQEPFGLVVVTNTLGHALGGIELYGFEEAFFDEYLAGRKTDHDFDADLLAKPNEIVRQKRLYCAITRDERMVFDGFSGTRDGKGDVRDHLLRVVSDIIDRRYFAHMKPDEPLEIYALKASRHGGKLATRLGFEEKSNGSERKDETPLYRLIVTREELRAIVAEAMHYSSVVESDLHVIIEDSVRDD